MNISIDLNYFINQIESKNDQELLKFYYEHMTKHIEMTLNYLEIKKELLDFLLTYDNNKIIYNDLQQHIENSIQLIELDAIEYKNKFKVILFNLINKKNI
jgi:hypothetical protein